MRELLTRCGAALLLCVTLVGYRAHARVADHIDDLEYCFRIESPGPEWQLLSEADARKTMPNAIAGLQHPRGGQFFVRVESASSIEIDAYVEIMRVGLSQPDDELDEIEGVTYQGMPGRRWTATGRRKGMEFRYQHLVFLRDQFAFTLTGYCLLASTPEGATPVDLGVLERHFLLTPGTMRGRTSSTPPADARGPGWRVQAGVYQNAANGVEVRAPEGWRIAVGEELAQLNGSACVGLVSADPPAYVVWIIERLRGIDEAGYAALAEPAFGAEAKVAAPVAKSMFGLSFPIVRHDVPGALPLVFLRGSRLRDSTAIQVVAWYSPGDEKLAKPKVERAFKCARFLDAASRLALASELSQQRDPQNVVGATYCLRNGVYRNFEHAFTWTKPAGFWKVDTGDEAAAHHEDAIIVVHSEETGITGLVTVEPEVELDTRAYHDLVLEDFETTEKPSEPQSLEVGGSPAVCSVLHTKIETLELTYHIVTFVRNRRAYLMQLWSLPGNMAAGRSVLDAAVQGLQVFDSLPATEQTSNSFTNHRLGFRLSKPAGEKGQFVDGTPQTARVVSSSIVLVGNLVAMAGSGTCVLGEQQDPRIMIDAVIQQLRSKDNAPIVEDDGVLAGLPARRITQRGADLTATFYIAQRDRTQYVFGVSAFSKPGAPTEEEAAKLFELIE